VVLEEMPLDGLLDGAEDVPVLARRTVYLLFAKKKKKERK
jgi:hypothetical protein